MRSRLAAFAGAVLVASGLLAAGSGPVYADPCSDEAAGSNELTAAAVIPGTSHGWAAGNGSTILHHTHGWHRVPVAGAGITFKGITAGSSTSVYAVGYARAPHCQPLPVMEHLRAGSFHRVRLPQLGYATLRTVSASGPNNVWAVGDNGRNGNTLVVLHYNGRHWARVSTGGVGAHGTAWDVATSGPHDVWIVSIYSQTQVLHYDGSSWTRTPLPAVGQANVLLFSIATGAGGTWAVGAADNPPHYSAHTLAYQWRASHWVRVPTPNPTNDAGLAGVAVIGHQAIAVGSFSKANNNRPLVLRFAAGRWRRLSATHDHVNSVLSDVAVSTRFRFAAGGWSTIVDAAGTRHGHAWIEQPHAGAWRPVHLPTG